MISQKELHRVLDYNTETGVFTWKVTIGNNVSRRNPGDVAGCPRSEGSYVQIRVHRIRYYAHRLAWFYVHGVWPKYIDHADCNKQNNALKNLREATASQNAANSGALKTNRLGVKGIRKLQRKRKLEVFEVRVCRKTIGRYQTLDEAKAVYAKSAVLVYGAFARNE